MERLFVALWPDAQARAGIRHAVEEGRRAHPELRWQPEERWHVTLAFLGRVDTAASARRLDALAHRGLPQPEPIRTAGAGAFGPVLWLGIEHGEWLTTLADQVLTGLHADDQRFNAHLTVARARGEAAATQARAAVPTLTEHLGPHWLPDEVTLVASRTGPTPDYHVRHRWPLGATDDDALRPPAHTHP